jgi:hypothetical protein
MKKLIVPLIVMLFSDIASAQVNKMDPPTQAIPAPGTPIIENATQKINKEEVRNGAPTPIVTAPRSNTPPSTTVRAKDRQPERREAPIGNSALPGTQMAYPTAQGPLEPGTGVTTGPTTGTNNPINTLPASNTTNQGKLP